MDDMFLVTIKTDSCYICKNQVPARIERRLVTEITSRYIACTICNKFAIKVEIYPATYYDANATLNNLRSDIEYSTFLRKSVEEKERILLLRDTATLEQEWCNNQVARYQKSIKEYNTVIDKAQSKYDTLLEHVRLQTEQDLKY